MSGRDSPQPAEEAATPRQALLTHTADSTHDLAIQPSMDGSSSSSSLTSLGPAPLAFTAPPLPLATAASPQSSPSASTAPFEALSDDMEAPKDKGGRHRMKGESGLIVSAVTAAARRRSRELIPDPSQPLPHSTPPPFLHLPSPPPQERPRSRSLSRSSNHHEEDSEEWPLASSSLDVDSHQTRLWWLIWRRRLRELLSPTSWFYSITHAAREVHKRPFQYLLGLFSCFLVVVVAAVCHTLIARAPVVFLQQAETAAGQVDLTLRPAAGLQARFVNYTTLQQNIRVEGSRGGRGSKGIEKDFGLHASRTELPAYVLPLTGACASDPSLYPPFEPSWKYVGFNDARSPSCTSTSVSCIEKLCAFPAHSLQQSVPLTAIDTLQEKRMGYGRLWPHDPLQEGEVLITSDLATNWKVRAGDTVMIKLGYPDTQRIHPFDESITALLRAAMAKSIHLDSAHPRPDANSSVVLDNFVTTFGRVVYIPLTIRSILTKPFGKFDTDTKPRLVVEQQHFFNYILQHVHPALTTLKKLDEMAALMPDQHEVQEAIQHAEVESIPYTLVDYPTQISSSLINLASYATSIHFNLPDRVDIYLDTNYDVIREQVISWSSRLLYLAGFTQLDSALPVLSEMDGFKMFSLYLGLILSLILTILFLLSAMLIYSLLLISIEARTFELGVHRMCGLTRWSLIKLLLVQAMGFSIPAWVIGLSVAQVVAAIVVGMLEDSVEVPLNNLLTPYSIQVASIMGLLCPLLASILPIRTALGHNLQDALDTRHSKTVGVKFNIERSVDGGINTTWLVVGVFMTALGFGIYYLMPLALLAMNLALMLHMFFALLLGLLMGLILLALNFQPLLERMVVFLFLWWESLALRTLVLNNLVTHRVRNRKTSIMFALSLGFILFITLAFQIEIYSAKARTLKNQGADMVVYASRHNSLSPSSIHQLESLLSTWIPSTISSWGWISSSLVMNEEFDETLISNLGHAFNGQTEIFGVSPNVFEEGVSFLEYLLKDSNTPHTTDTSISEQLYTAAGSQAAILGTSTKQQFGLSNTDGVETSFLFALQKRANEEGPASLQLRRLRPLTFLDLSPRFRFGRFPTTRTQPSVVSLDTFLRLAGGAYSRVQELPMSACLLQFSPGVSSRQKDRLYRELSTFTGDRFFSVFDQRRTTSQLDQSNQVMGLVFSIATAIALFLCLFSLVASMISNIHEQSKELSVLRSLGLTQAHVLRLYCYEAFVLVMSASALGIAIGVVMGGTMLAQRILLTQLPVPFQFPWPLLVYTFVGSCLCAVAAALFPAKRLMRQSIASIMKNIL